ncbi:hypothetical protein [Arthrospira sp. PCC 8006]|uniref:hypothetical protein n=1 Tax=Arthrospira sp. PCC 8006 TaxID=1982224 RepID=UPI00396F4508
MLTIEMYECDRSGIYLWLKVNMIAVGSRRGNPLGYQCTTIPLSMYKDIRLPIRLSMVVRLLGKYWGAYSLPTKCDRKT